MSPARAERLPPEANPELVREMTTLAQAAPEPAVVGHVRVATAGWTDRTLLASRAFYPPALKNAGDRLAFYARHFAFVEVDATFYSLLTPDYAERWVASTPPTFKFDVKAHPIVTGHPMDVERLPKDLAEAIRAELPEAKRIYGERLPSELSEEIERRFRSLLEPLARESRLGCVLAQFPPWFEATRANARRLEALAEAWAGTQVAVEFRHKSWLAEERRTRVFELLGKLGLAFVCVDEPATPVGGLPRVAHVTTPALAVVRMHGRNQVGWETRGASVHQRFDYLYSAEELRSWVAPVRELADRAEDVHVVFNNCVRNYAVLDAKGFGVLLAQADA
jgi:uncharacterized protein YecE (DUF72 family)